MEPAGRVAIVTGAAVGTGRAIARRLAQAGAAVVLADTDAAGCADTGRLIEGDGGRAAFVPTDVTSPPDVAAMVDFAVARFGALHILVNNAGGGGHVPPHFPDATAEEWGALLDLNLRGPMLATQLVLAPMRSSGGGVVVNIASTAALGYAAYPSPEYAAAKAGLIRFTATLAELPGVRVTCVVPDWVGTERAARERAKTPPEQRVDWVPLEDFTAEVLALIEDDTAAGRVTVLLPGRNPTVLA